MIMLRCLRINARAATSMNCAIMKSANAKSFYTTESKLSNDSKI